MPRAQQCSPPGNVKEITSCGKLSHQVREVSYRYLSTPFLPSFCPLPHSLLVSRQDGIPWGRRSATDLIRSSRSHTPVFSSHSCRILVGYRIVLLHTYHKMIPAQHQIPITRRIGRLKESAHSRRQNSRRKKHWPSAAHSLHFTSLKFATNRDDRRP